MNQCLNYNPLWLYGGMLLFYTSIRWHWMCNCNACSLKGWVHFTTTGVVFLMLIIQVHTELNSENSELKHISTLCMCVTVLCCFQLALRSKLVVCHDSDICAEKLRRHRLSPIHSIRSLTESFVLSLYSLIVCLLLSKLTFCKLCLSYLIVILNEYHITCKKGTFR